MSNNNIMVEKNIEMRKIGEIRPYIRNPRKNDKTVDLLCKVIPKVGFNVPILVDPNGVIIKGHARYTAAIRLGMTEVPCIVSHASEEAIRADRITDNKISEFSEWVNDELLHEMDAIDFDLDFGEMGLPVTELEDIPAPADFEPDEPQISEEERNRLYEEFLRKQEEEAAKPVEIVTQADIDKAKEVQQKTAAEPPRYYKCVCEKCGHVMFVKEGDLFDRV